MVHTAENKNSNKQTCKNIQYKQYCYFPINIKVWLMIVTMSDKETKQSKTRIHRMTYRHLMKEPEEEALQC